MAEPGVVTARNPGIDLLRGLAILLVVFNHLGLRMPLKQTALADVLPSWLLVRLNYNGYEAVFVFFVISGFLIAGNAARRWGSLARIDARAFYARRFARIVPCLLVLVAVLSVLDLVGVRDYTILHANQSLPRAILAAPGLHLNWYEGQTGYLPGNWDVLWSLSIEEVFYLGFPLACLLTRQRAVLVPLLVLLALSMPVDACGAARQRGLAGESLPAGHVGDRDRRAGCLARLALQATAAANDASAWHARCAGAGGGPAGVTAVLAARQDS